jgi:hypothetical protein
MSNSPYGAMPPAPAPWPPHGPPPARQPSRAPILIVGALAVLALGVAIGGWFRPTTTVSAPPAAPEYSAQEVADAQKALCDAYDKTFGALQVAGAEKSEDPGEGYAMAVNVRLAGHIAASYLTDVLRSNPAAPDGIAKPVSQLAAAYTDTVIGQIAGENEVQLKSTLDAMNSAATEIRQACQ